MNNDEGELLAYVRQRDEETASRHRRNLQWFWGLVGALVVLAAVAGLVVHRQNVQRHEQCDRDQFARAVLGLPTEAC